MPTISIIVPVYKVENFLDRCIQSIIHQTYSDYELILVDDGSPDNCPKLCDEWAKKDRRIIVIHQMNMGLSAARNAGIKIARGKYLTFVDSDDWIANTMLEDLYGIICKYGADIAMCNHLRTSKEIPIIPEKKEKISVYTHDEFMKIFLRITTNRCIHYAWGKLYSKNVIDTTEHFPVGLLNEDVEGMFKAITYSTCIVETTKIGYFYFENRESITKQKFGNNFLSLTKVWKRILELSKKINPAYSKYVEYNLMRTDFTILVDMILYGDFSTDKMYSKEYAIIRRRLKKNFRKLCNGPMSNDRKVAMLMICYFFTPINKIYRLIPKGRF